MPDSSPSSARMAAAWTFPAFFQRQVECPSRPLPFKVRICVLEPLCLRCDIARSQDMRLRPVSVLNYGSCNLESADSRTLPVCVDVKSSCKRHLLHWSRFYLPVRHAQANPPTERTMSAPAPHTHYLRSASAPNIWHCAMQLARLVSYEGRIYISVGRSISFVIPSRAAIASRCNVPYGTEGRVSSVNCHCTLALSPSRLLTAHYTRHMTPRRARAACHAWTDAGRLYTPVPDGSLCL